VYGSFANFVKTKNLWVGSSACSSRKGFLFHLAFDYANNSPDAPALMTVSKVLEVPFSFFFSFKCHDATFLHFEEWQATILVSILCQKMKNN